MPCRLRADETTASQFQQTPPKSQAGASADADSSTHTTPHPNNQFIRYKEDATGGWLQSAITTYRNAQGVTVTLIGAIHIADSEYYEQLNEIFKKHDAVLYEMVGGPIQKRNATASPQKQKENDRKDQPSTDPHKSEETVTQAEIDAAQRLAWLSPFHTTLKNTLNLESQLEGIDYYAPNFVHADMTHTQFAAKQREKNESFLTLWLKSIQIQMENPQMGQSQPGLLKILEILTRNDSATELKRIFARTFDSVDSLIADMESGDGTVILSERNKVALEILQKQIQLGKKTPAIFYGAAHLPDMEKRLFDMGFQKIDTQWLNAWSLPPEPDFESDKQQVAPSANSTPNGK